MISLSLCYFNYMLMYNLTFYFILFWYFCELCASLDLLSDCSGTALALGKGSVHNKIEADTTNTNNSLLGNMQLHSNF